MTDKYIDLIRTLANTDLTESDILDALYKERSRKDDLNVCRNDLVDAFVEYLKVITPDIDISEDDIEFLNKQLDNFEKDFAMAADILKKTTDKKDNTAKTECKCKNKSDKDIFDEFFKALSI